MQDWLKAIEQPSTRRIYVEALRAYARGDRSKLVEYLRSDRPIEREWLAQVINGEVFQPKNGRPRDKNVRIAAMLARIIYRRWKEMNKKTGVGDHGVSEHMKDEACRYAIELEPWDDDQPDFDRVREMIDRPISRQK